MGGMISKTQLTEQGCSDASGNWWKVPGAKGLGMYLGCVFGGVGRALDTVLSIWTICGHTAVHLVLSCPEQGVISAHISTIPSTDTRGKAKLQSWPGTGSKLAKTPEKQPVPMGAGVMLRRMVVPGVHGGIQQSTAVGSALG